MSTLWLVTGFGCSLTERIDYVKVDAWCWILAFRIGLDAWMSMRTWMWLSIPLMIAQAPLIWSILIFHRASSIKDTSKSACKLCMVESHQMNENEKMLFIECTSKGINLSVTQLNAMIIKRIVHIIYIATVDRCY